LSVPQTSPLELQLPNDDVHGEIGSTVCLEAARPRTPRVWARRQIHPGLATHLNLSNESEVIDLPKIYPVLTAARNCAQVADDMICIRDCQRFFA
jgi:hypothetical protein